MSDDVIDCSRKGLLSGTLPLSSGWGGRWPRLFADEEEIRALAHRLAADPAWARRYFPADDDPRLKGTPRRLDEGAVGGRIHSYDLLAMPWFALLHRLTGRAEFLTAARAYVSLLVPYADAAPLSFQIHPKGQDLDLGHYLWALASGFDLLKGLLPDAEESLLRRALAVQAASADAELRDAISRPSWDQHPRGWTFRPSYEQNHAYIPVGGLLLAGLVLDGLEAEAPKWAGLARNILDRSAAALSGDGFFYEGASYLGYAYHWMVMCSAALRRLTGEDWFGRGLFSGVEQFLAHTVLPGGKFVFDFGDWGPRKGQPGYEAPWHTHPTNLSVWFLLGIEKYGHPSPARRAVINALLDNEKEPFGIGLFQLLWGNGAPVPARSLTGADGIRPWHYFADHEAVFWRTSWDDPDATAVMLKCGPPEGHHALEIQRRYPEWEINSGHAHPDAGAFLIWSRGRFLAGDTGYCGIKRACDHNTILVDGRGHFGDGRYHVYDDVDYAKLHRLCLRDVRLSERVVEATAVFEDAYDKALDVDRARRHFLMIDGSCVVVRDELVTKIPRIFTWLLHVDHEPRDLGDGLWLVENGPASMLVGAMGTVARTFCEPAVVTAFTGRPDTGEPVQRGWRIVMESAPSAAQEFLTVMAIFSTGDALPQIRRGDDGQVEIARGGSAVRISTQAPGAPRWEDIA